MSNIHLLDDLSDDDYSHIKEAGIVAVDCEMSGLNPHRDLLYIVTVYDDKHGFRTLRRSDWHEAKNLSAMLSNPMIQKVFHFAIMDCAFLFTKVHQQVVNAYCTKIASKISRTYSSSHSLSSIVGELFNVKIDKQMQTSFWGDEDISEERREYLISDCRYLLDLKHTLEEIMDKKGILPTGISYRELNQNCQAFIPTLVHLWVNGWDFGKEDQDSVFGR